MYITAWTRVNSRNAATAWWQHHKHCPGIIIIIIIILSIYLFSTTCLHRYTVTLLRYVITELKSYLLLKIFFTHVVDSHAM